MDNYLAEIFGMILGGIIGIYIEKFRKVKQFYSAIIPVVKQLRELKEIYNITPKETQEFVKLVSNSFSSEMLGTKHAPQIYKTAYRDIDENKTCQICELPAKLNGKDGCVNCKLDCCAWDFEKIEKQK